MSSDPLFLRYINGDTDVSGMLLSFMKSKDKRTADAAEQTLKNVPDLSEFKKELTEAVEDIITEGLDEGFRAFVNHYMGTLEEDLDIKETPRGENRSQVARIGDEKGPWIQGFVCYNLCLYIKAFGLENLKRCPCGKFFAHKGKYARYCSDPCKKKWGKSGQQTSKAGKTPGSVPPV